MAPDAFVAERTAFVFIDLMEATLASVRTIPGGELRAHAGYAAEMCGLFEIPALFAMAPLPGAAVLQEIARAVPSLRTIEHSTNDSWNTPAFVEAVVSTGRKQLVFAGIATDVGVGLTALSAVRAGYQTAVLTDLCGAVSTRAEQAMLTRLVQAGVTLTAWSSLLGELAVDYTRGKGPQAFALLRRTL